MSEIVKRHPRLRRGAGALIVLAVAADLAILAISAYAHVARDHVVVRVGVEHEIVQVLVNCRLAAAVTAATPAGGLPLELGWLDRGDVVTIQVRGRKQPGFYSVSLQHGSRSAVVLQGAQPGTPQRFPSGRVIATSSLTAGGRALGDLGCQPDSPARLAFASSGTGQPATWGGGSRVPIDAARTLSPVVPVVLAVIGALGLIAAAIYGGVQHGPIRRTLAEVVGVLVNIFIAVLLGLGGRDFGVALGLCVVAGVASLLIALVWLLKDDLRALCSRALRLPAVPGAAHPRASSEHLGGTH